ncbi:hypothetical protein B0O99DRAFT_617123 [Bisporella sp. PMI_857]|nr:hypothetical protein B0O99DRAFT_617123 [Bisporella sp. PMI_857]
MIGARVLQILLNAGLPSDKCTVFYLLTRVSWEIFLPSMAWPLTDTNMDRYFQAVAPALTFFPIKIDEDERSVLPSVEANVTEHDSVTAENITIKTDLATVSHELANERKTYLYSMDKPKQKPKEKAQGYYKSQKYALQIISEPPPYDPGVDIGIDVDGNPIQIVRKPIIVWNGDGYFDSPTSNHQNAQDLTKTAKEEK